MSLFQQQSAFNNLWVKFKVIDTGIGIDNSRLHNIFNLFEKDSRQNISIYINER